MIPVTQTKTGGPDDPPEERGDCFDACIASILEVSIGQMHVPHTGDWWDLAQATVARHGHRIFNLQSSNSALPASTFGEWLGPVYWIAGVPSQNVFVGTDCKPAGHCIVMRGGDVAHDPSLGQRYPLGPLPDDIPIDMVLLLLPLAEAIAA